MFPVLAIAYMRFYQENIYILKSFKFHLLFVFISLMTMSMCLHTYLEFVLLTGDTGNAGQGFAPHVINVAAGEVMLLYSFQRFDSIYIDILGSACHVQAFAHTHTII